SHITALFPCCLSRYVITCDLGMAKPPYSVEVEEALIQDVEQFGEQSRSREAYRDAYYAANRDLAKLLAEQQMLEKKKLVLRKTLETLAALCESVGATVDRSVEAATLLDRFSLAAETKNVVRSLHP